MSSLDKHRIVWRHDNNRPRFAPRPRLIGGRGVVGRPFHPPNKICRFSNKLCPKYQTRGPPGWDDGKFHRDEA